MALEITETTMTATVNNQVIATATRTGDAWHVTPWTTAGGGRCDDLVAERYSSSQTITRKRTSPSPHRGRQYPKKGISSFFGLHAEPRSSPQNCPVRSVVLNLF